MALACYGHQTYPHRELIVVDDGDRFPVDRALIAARGGMLVRAEPGTKLGTKLNLGVEAARGPICQKMDDDDWYAPTFLETMLRGFLEHWSVVCRPTLAYLMPFLFFEVAAWEIRRSVDQHIPGATLMFARSGWEEHPFRNLRGDEDSWFFLDQRRLGAPLVPVDALEIFLAVRHAGGSRERGHTWTRQATGQSLEEYLAERPLYHRAPDAMLPPWALDVYREIRHDLQAPHPTPA